MKLGLLVAEKNVDRQTYTHTQDSCFISIDMHMYNQDLDTKHDLCTFEQFRKAKTTLTTGRREGRWLVPTIYISPEVLCKSCNFDDTIP